MRYLFRFFRCFSPVCLAIAVLLHSQPSLSASGEILNLRFGEAVSGEAKPSATEIGEHSIPRLETPPDIDGSFHDAAWSHVEGTTLKGAKKDVPATTVQIGYDDDWLYFLFRCKLSKNSPVKKEITDRDGGVWKDDAVEICLESPGKAGGVYRFILNAGGTVYDSANGSTAYNSNLKQATRIQEGEWVAEIGIPHDALGLETWVRSLSGTFGRHSPRHGTVPFTKSGLTNPKAGVLIFEGAPEAAVQAEPEEKAGHPEEELLQSRFDLVNLRPGERWLRGTVKVNGGKVKFGPDSKVRATLFPYGGDAGSEVATSLVAAGPAGEVRVDLRSAGLSRATLRLELIENGKRIAVEETALFRPKEKLLAEGTRIPIRLDVSEKARPTGLWPVTFGVPFPAGELWEIDRVRLVDESGKPVPHQKQATATWFAEGSIKWIRIDALVDPARPLFVEIGAGSRATPGVPRLVVEKKGDKILVTNGDYSYVLGPDKSPIESISLRGTELASSGDARGLYVVDQNGRTASASAKNATMDVEAEGPLAACIRFEGPYLTAEGEELARHITRVEFVAGQPWARVYHSLVITRDTQKLWLSRYGWELRVAAGGEPTALFADSHEKWDRFSSLPLRGESAAYMFQRSHYHFFKGENRFEIAAQTGKEAPALVKEGGECGDWAALSGQKGGLLVGCRNAALMHPKEFFVAPNKIDLLLFSNRGGEELDFRLETLIKRWDYKNLLAKADPRKNYEQAEKKFLGNSNDAVGWSKTHELIFVPIASDEQPATFALPAGLLSNPVYALADPAWLYRTRAMGPLHPYDPEKFPEVEAYAEQAVALLRDFSRKYGEFGIFDFEAGPHFMRSLKDGIPILRRYRNGYFTRPDLWSFYARRGLREAREFAQGANRFYLDSCMVHAGSGEKQKGLFANPSGSDTDQGMSPFNLPVYWGSTSVLEVSGSTDMDMFSLDYYLTGYRRAKDMMSDYAEGVKNRWAADNPRGTWRLLRVMQTIAQCYAFDWNPEMGDLLRRTVNLAANEKGQLYLTNQKPYGTPYKTQADFTSVLTAYEVTGDPRLKEMALRIANFWRDSYLNSPISYCNPDAAIADFLYRENGDLMTVENMAIKLRQLVTERDSTGAPATFSLPSSTFIIKGFAWAQSVVTEAKAWPGQRTSYFGLENTAGPVEWFFHHPADVNLELRVQVPKSHAQVGRTGGGVVLGPAGQVGNYGNELNRVEEVSNSTAVALVPYDSPQGVYRLFAAEPGPYFVMASRKVPLTARVQGFWRPRPDQEPMPSIYFPVSADAENPRLYIQGRGVLTSPGGTKLRDGKALSGWVDLKGQKAGTWQLDLERACLLNLDGTDPLFAIGSPEFLVELPPGASPPALPLPSLVDEESVGGLRIKPQDRLAIELGPELQDPALWSDATVEFYFKPGINSAEAGSDGSFLLFRTNDSTEASLRYPLPRDASPFAFVARASTVNAVTGKPGIRASAIRPQFFEADRWYHIAMVWGEKVGVGKKGASAAGVQVYVDGRNERIVPAPVQGGRINLNPVELVMGPGLDGEIRGLRISTGARYLRDFKPPSPEALKKRDAGTLATFSFENGDIKPGYGAARVKK